MIGFKIDSVEKLELVNHMIFETAIYMPLYSVAYANMCRVLTDAVSKISNYLNTVKLPYGNLIKIIKTKKTGPLIQKLLHIFVIFYHTYLRNFSFRSNN